MDDFVLRALAAGVGIALVAGPLGCFVLWRRMAFFGAALAHSALLGIALGFALGVSPNLGIFVVALLVALVLTALGRQHQLSGDTVLGIVAHVALAAGLVVFAFLETLRVDLLAYLFGDLLSVSRADLLWIYGGGLAVLATLAALWRPLLSLTVHAELAQVEGIPATRLNLVFMLLIALTVAVAVKIVGLLLVTALLVVPAAAARRASPTPERMAALASLTGCLSVLGGLGASLAWDAPTGPAVVVVAGLFFMLSLLLPRAKTP